VPAALVNDPREAVRSAARMIAAAMARAGRSAHPAEAQAIDASLLALYRGARDARESVELLDALGNSAGPEVVPVIETALESVEPTVRAAAARALRLAPGDHVDRLLAAAITADRDPGVRADAIFSARFRRPLSETLREALEHAASHDEVEYVRRSATAVLRPNPQSGGSSNAADVTGRR
jgi:hypothetical protein